MKKLVLLLVAALTFALFSACSTKKEKELEGRDANKEMIDSLRQALTQTKNESNDLLETIAQIQEGFDRINEAEGRVTVQTKSGEYNNSQAIIENMAFIERTMKLNKELISNLKQQLRTANRNDDRSKKKLEEMINKYNTQLEEKTEEILKLRKELEQMNIRLAEQDARINALNKSVDDLNRENAEKESTLAAQDEQLHTVYYVFGTKKELREQHIVKRGGDLLMTEQFNKDYFTRKDSRVLKTIKLYSKSAKVLTNHPEGSYTLDKDAQGQYAIRITDPQKFWSVSKYLVIVVK